MPDPHKTTEATPIWRVARAITDLGRLQLKTIPTPENAPPTMEQQTIREARILLARYHRALIREYIAELNK